MQSNFYTNQELRELGLKSVGKNVLISKKSSIYNASKISIGDNVRIDDFCILSGNITLGNYIHIAAYSALYGGSTEQSEIIVEDFCNISSRVAIYAISDDYSGESMTSPLIPDKYKKIEFGIVHIHKHAIIGTTSVVLPSAEIEEGCALGAFSLVKDKLEKWGIYTGIPCKRVKERSKKIIDFEQQFRMEQGQHE